MHEKPQTLIDSHVGDLLSAYIDGRLTPGERLRVETHLPACSPCRADLVALQETVSLLKGLPVVATPRPFYVYPDMLPARRSRFDLGALFRPAWTYGALRLATSAAAMLLVLVVAVDALSIGTFGAAAPAVRPVALSEASTTPLLKTDALPAAEATAPAKYASPASPAPAVAPRAAIATPAATAVAEPTRASAPAPVPAPATADVGAGPTLAPQAAAIATAVPAAQAMAVPTATAAPVAGVAAAPSPTDALKAGQAAPAPAAATEAPKAGPTVAAAPAPVAAAAEPSPPAATSGKSAATAEPGRQEAVTGAAQPTVGAASFGDTARDAEGMPAIRAVELGLVALVAVLAMVTVLVRSRRTKEGDGRQA